MAHSTLATLRDRRTTWRLPASTTAQLVAVLYWQEALNHVQCRQLDRQLLEAMKSA